MDLLTDPDKVLQSVKNTTEVDSELQKLRYLCWDEKYRPTKLADIILPDSIKNSVGYALSNNNFQNMIFFSNSPGTGKTTVAKVIPEEHNCDYIFIKTATEGRLDTIENQIQNYGMQKTYNDKPRFVILDEADRVRSNDMERFYTALQPIIESTRTTLRFILTVNHLHRIPKPIRSRCVPISFAHNDDSVKKPMWNRIKQIAQYETTQSGGELDLETLKQIAKIHFPDMRSMIAAMQNNFNSNNGSIKGRVEEISTDHIKKVWELLQTKDITDVRLYFTENIGDISGFYSPFLDHIINTSAQDEKLKQKLLSLGVIIGEHQFRDSGFEVNPEINSFSMFCKIKALLG